MFQQTIVNIAWIQTKLVTYLIMLGVIYMLNDVQIYSDSFFNLIAYSKLLKRPGVYFSHFSQVYQIVYMVQISFLNFLYYDLLICV